MMYLTKAFIKIGLLIILTVAGLYDPSSSVYASTPTVIVGMVDPESKRGCIGSVTRQIDLDTFTRDSLPQEVSPSWHPEALRANAILIRSTAYHFHLNPESNDPVICAEGHYFHLRPSRVVGWASGRGATEGNSHNKTNDRVTDTGGKLLYKNGRPFLVEWGSCIQNKTHELAKQGYNYEQILTDPNIGVFSQASGCIYKHTGLSINQGYDFTPSMTNGTSPYPVLWGATNSSVTPVWTARQAESYWGHSGMDVVHNQPFGQSGRYMVGYHTGDKVEYRMWFGSKGGRNYANLNLIGIADKGPLDPNNKAVPVILNIYVDGYYQRTIQWKQHDNRRHIRVENVNVQPVPGWFSYGQRAITIEFANDACICSPYHPDQDRNFYLDVFAITDGWIHPREEVFPPLFDPKLYMPLILR